MTMLSKWLADTSKIVSGTGYAYIKTRPHIKCPDGFAVSVQAGRSLYCSPRDDNGGWHEVEIGYPSERVESWMEYCEDPDKPTDTVYGHVPIDVVEAELVRRGWTYESSEETR